MAETQTAPNNKAVAFRGKPMKEDAKVRRALARGLVSRSALKKARP
jgi:hypothetical protein